MKNTSSKKVFIESGVICSVVEPRFVSFAYESEEKKKFSVLEKQIKSMLLSNTDGIRFDDPEVILSEGSKTVGKLQILLFKGKIKNFRKGVLADYYDMLPQYKNFDDFYEDYPESRKEVEKIRNFMNNKSEEEEACLAIVKIPLMNADYVDFICDVANAVPELIKELDTGFDNIDTVSIV